MSGVKKAGDNVLGTGFQIRFVERVYDGAPRWLSADYFKHVIKIDHLDREQSVRDKIRHAHKPLFDAFDVLLTCVKPDCPDRQQSLRPQAEWGRDGKADDKLRTDMVQLARGKPDKLGATCPACGQKLLPLQCWSPRRKWVYVLKEQGKSLAPFCEIEIDDGGSGFIYGSYDKSGKRFQDKGRTAFPGYLTLPPDQSKHVWHFFMSPVRLGPKAMGLLIQAPEREAELAAQRDRYGTAGKAVPVVPALQPWAATVRRKFSAEQVKTHSGERIPLADPFAWVAAVVDLDLVPILGAQQELIRNADEQAKAFVAAVLHSAIARRQVSKDPPRWEEDAWDVKDDTVAPPAQFKSSGNIAKAWLDRYERALTFLTEQVQAAGTRVVFALRFGAGHRIVEQACQERAAEPGCLAIGMLHWLHALKDLLLCRPGEAFLAWLVENKEAAEHIPVRNVLGGESAGKGSRLQKESPGLALQLLALLDPAVIRSAAKPADEIVKHLEKIDVRAATPGTSEVKLAKDTVVSIGDAVLEKYLEKLPKRLQELGEEVVLAKEYGARSWKARLSALDNAAAFEDGVGLLLGLKAYTEEAGAYDTPYDKYGKTKAKIEYPLKVADYLSKQSRRLIKARLSGEAASVIAKVEAEGTAVIGKLSAQEYEILLANRSVRAYRTLATGARILAGPVAIVLGGADLIAESGKTITEWQAGDPGAAVGHALMAGAAICTIAVAAAETTALVSGAATAAWVGPVGWIAAGLLLIGALVMALCAKNDLEKFAQHCWLGPDYGDGDWDDETGKPWMANKPWPWLRYAGAGSAKEAPDRWQRQRLALLRMISGFKTICHAGSYCGGQIYPGYLAGSTAFEIEIDVSPAEKGAAGKKETYRAVVWPTARDWMWVGQEPQDDSYVSMTPNTRGEKVAVIKVQARPRGFSGRVDYQLRVRLALDGAGDKFGAAHHYLPVSKSWVINNVSGYSEADSGKVD